MEKETEKEREKERKNTNTESGIETKILFVPLLACELIKSFLVILMLRYEE